MAYVTNEAGVGYEEFIMITPCNGLKQDGVRVIHQKQGYAIDLDNDAMVERYLRMHVKWLNKYLRHNKDGVVSYVGPAVLIGDDDEC